MTEHNFIINMACQRVLHSLLGKSMALLMKVNRKSGKLQCGVGTLFLFTFEQIIEKDISSPQTLNGLGAPISRRDQFPCDFRGGETKNDDIIFGHVIVAHIPLGIMV